MGLAQDRFPHLLQSTSVDGGKAGRRKDRLRRCLRLDRRGRCYPAGSNSWPLYLFLPSLISPVLHFLGQARPQVLLILPGVTLKSTSFSPLLLLQPSSISSVQG